MTIRVLDSDANLPAIVRIIEKGNLDRTVGVARTTARRDNRTVLIERAIKRRDGSELLVPVLEITPGGDIREVSPPSLRVSLGDRFLHHFESIDPTSRWMNFLHNMANMVIQSRDYLQAEAEHARIRRVGNHRNRRSREPVAAPQFSNSGQAQQMEGKSGCSMPSTIHNGSTAARSR